jgi:hypothetical protein
LQVLELHKRTIRRKKRESACRLRQYYYKLLKQCVTSRQTILENYSTNNSAWVPPANNNKRTGNKHVHVRPRPGRSSSTDNRARELMERAEKRVAKEMRQIELDSMFSFGKRSQVKLEETSASESSSDEDGCSSSSSMSPAPAPGGDNDDKFTGEDG